MSRPDLVEGEVVLFSTRRHPLVLLLPMVLLGAAGSAAVAVVCPLVQMLASPACPSAAGLGLAVAGEVLLLDWLSTRFILTNYRLIHLQTPLWRRSRTLPLVAVASISLQQDVLGRVLGFGTVTAHSSATHGSRICLDFVADPEGLCERIATAVLDVPGE